MKIICRILLAFLVVFSLSVPSQAGWKWNAIKAGVTYGVVRAAPVVARRWGPELVERYGPRIGAAALETALTMCARNAKCDAFVAAAGAHALIGIIDELGVRDFIDCLRVESCNVIQSEASVPANSGPVPGPSVPPTGLDDKARKHVLEGEGPGKGGHRPGTGMPGKSEFPAGYTDEEIEEVIVDIAGDESVVWVPAAKKGYILGSGTRDGLDIEVIYDPAGERIVSGYPTNVPRNPW